MVNGKYEWGLDNMTKANLKNILTAVRDIINRSSEIGIRKAQAAEKRADNAQAAADNAQTTADNAQTTANAAQTTADNAQTTANAAQTAADQLQARVSEVLYKNISFEFDQRSENRDNFIYNGYRYYKISDFSPDATEVIAFHGTQAGGSVFSLYKKGTNCDQYGFFIVVTTAGSCSLPVNDNVTAHFTAPSTGLYACYTPGNLDQTAGVGEFILPLKYSSADANIQPIISNIKYIEIKSSTTGSSKKFRITVDDTGALSATRVTA